MANTILTPTQVTREALRILHNKLSFIGAINRQYDDSFAKDGGRIGDTLKIRLPNQYTVRTGATLSAQDTTESSMSLQVGTQKGVDMSFTSAEMTLSLDDFSSRILEPAMSVLAANIEADVLSNAFKDVYNVLGAPGTTPNSLRVFLDAGARLDNCLAPRDNNRSVLVTPDAQASMVDALKGLFQSSETIADQYERGVLGMTGGFSFYSSPNVQSHTNGLQAGTPLTNGVGQTGSTLATDGWTASTTITRGTVFTIAGVYAVHPETKAQLPYLQQFVVTADATASGGGAASLAISPAIVTTGAARNVSVAAPDNAAMTIATGSASTAYAQNLAFHRDFCVFATADLASPDGVDFSAREVLDGISMRIVRGYDINGDTFPCRIDVLYGYKVVRPQLAVRITS